MGPPLVIHTEGELDGEKGGRAITIRLSDESIAALTILTRRRVFFNVDIFSYIDGRAEIILKVGSSCFCNSFTCM